MVITVSVKTVAKKTMLITNFIMCLFAFHLRSLK